MMRWCGLTTTTPTPEAGPVAVEPRQDETTGRREDGKTETPNISLPPCAPGGKMVSGAGAFDGEGAPSPRMIPQLRGNDPREVAKPHLVPSPPGRGPG